MSVYDAATSGDRRRTLEALRDHLATQIEGAVDRRLIHLAPLSAQLTKVLQELDSLPAPMEGTALDELTRRRARRTPAAEGKAGPAGR